MVSHIISDFYLPLDKNSRQKQLVQLMNFLIAACRETLTGGSGFFIQADHPISHILDAPIQSFNIPTQTKFDSPIATAWLLDQKLLENELEVSGGSYAPTFTSTGGATDTLAAATHGAGRTGELQAHSPLNVFSLVQF